MATNSTWLNQVEKMTTAQRDLATDGELTYIFNTTKGVYEFYNGTSWVTMSQSELENEPTGSDQVLNIVSLTQAEYDAGTPNDTTFYIITDA
jgi:hypothetical protein